MRLPALNERLASSAPAGSAPVTRIPGLRPRAATAVPLINPPPPMGATTMSSSGACSSNSSVAVPCPAMTRRSSYGCTSAAPVWAMIFAAAASRAAIVGSQNTIFAPSLSTAARFAFGTLFGITMYAGMPRNFAARDRAAAWLPDECVATPRAASASDNENTALVAPRALNAPTFCMFSHLKNRLPSDCWSSVELVRTGVRWMRSRMRSCAARMASRVRRSGADVGSMAPILAELHTDRRVVAGFLLAAHPRVHLAVHQPRRERFVQQHVIDAQAGVALPVVAKEIPERIDALFGMALAQSVDPALREQPLVCIPRLRLQQRVLAPALGIVDVEIRRHDVV